MRLKTIKLSGFKSFVDPTIFTLQSNLTAIVGPNGCGKSNIVDAVRWVTGESSAKQLRGEALTDVIFNGSNERKPIGQASVELTFDNSDAGLGGEYARYSEISVRREITRDGQSHYYLNGARCRRRDIRGIFLGTGLGPRSYAIIEQGMISDLIEAKPEELRTYLEEAAGVSKYKERRRETENRIRRTRENLERLNDVREEVNQNLVHLKRQANAAKRYKRYKEEQRLLKAQLHLLQIQTLNQQLNEQKDHIQKQELVLEGKLAEHQHASTTIERSRDQQTECHEILNEVQGRYYRLGADISRIEQQIQYNQNRQLQLKQDILQTEKNLAESQEHLHEDRAQVELLQTELVGFNPQIEPAKQKVDSSNKILQEAEIEYREYLKQWDQANINVAETTQTAEVEQTRIQHLEQRITNLNKQISLIENQAGSDELSTLPTEIEELSKNWELLKEKLNTTQENSIALRKQIQNQRKQVELTREKLKNSRDKLQKLRRQEAQLEVLQKMALGKDDEATIEWLKGHKLYDKPRFAQNISVERGWEQAVEIVLGPYLDAIETDTFEKLASTIDDFKGNLVLSSTKQIQQTQPQNSLAKKVNTHWPIIHLLNAVYTAENLQQALAMQPTLKPHESVITRTGIWLGPSWLRLQKREDEKKGVINREQELLQLQKTIIQCEREVALQEETLEQQRQLLIDLEQKETQTQETLNEMSNQYSVINAELSVKKARFEQCDRNKRDNINALCEQQKLKQIAEQELFQARLAWQEALNKSESFIQQRDHLRIQRDSLYEQLSKLREQANQDQQAFYELTTHLESANEKQSYLKQNIGRIEQRSKDLNQHLDTLRQELVDVTTPMEVLKEELTQQLGRRLEIEDELNQSRENVNKLDHQLREFEQQRHQVEQQISQLRSQHEELKIAQSTLQVHNETHEKQINEAGFDIKQLSEEMPEDAMITTWEEKSSRIENRVQRLGPINLTAIEEHEHLSKRKEYLDAQNEDLLEALQTLEHVIRKIDRETRSRLRETYVKVNEVFQSLFPKVFGGGGASLEMTGDDVLNTGIIVKAQPPGKRNTTIHLLSGGEKALTAIALVFSFFQLNPACFCMLDEVDASLDDSNVARFCNLVKEMAHKLQFIFISHNKLSIEIAEQLSGITMHEPGVSRLVSVDIDEAIAMATN